MCLALFLFESFLHDGQFCLDLVELVFGHIDELFIAFNCLIILLAQFLFHQEWGHEPASLVIVRIDRFHLELQIVIEHAQRLLLLFTLLERQFLLTLEQVIQVLVLRLFVRKQIAHRPHFLLHLTDLLSDGLLLSISFLDFLFVLFTVSFEVLEQLLVRSVCAVGSLGLLVTRSPSDVVLRKLGESLKLLLNLFQLGKSLVVDFAALGFEDLFYFGFESTHVEPVVLLDHLLELSFLPL